VSHICAHLAAVLRVGTDQRGLSGRQARSERAQRPHITCRVTAFGILERARRTRGLSLDTLTRPRSCTGRSLGLPALEPLRSAAYYLIREGHAQALQPRHTDICGNGAPQRTIPDLQPEASPDSQGSREARTRLQDVQRPYDRRDGTAARQADVDDWAPTRRLRAMQAAIDPLPARLADGQHAGEGHTGVTRIQAVTVRVREWLRHSQDEGLER
jgi:hypothetical protein